MLLLTSQAVLFDLNHILYMVISFLLTAVLLALAFFFVKAQNKRDNFLKLWAVLTVVIHYSIIYVNFLKEGNLQIGENMIFAIHPCNVCMWLLLITAFVKNKNTVAFRLLAEFVFWAGTVCGIIGIVLNENYVGNGITDYEAFKGLVSHSTMIVGALYLLVGGYVKLRASNVLSVVLGLLLFVVNGALINFIYKLFDRGEPNSMYLQEAPFPNVPWLNTLVIGLIAVAVCFAITATYEQIALKREDRWYTRLHNLMKMKKEEKNSERVVF